MSRQRLSGAERTWILAGAYQGYISKSQHYKFFSIKILFLFFEDCERCLQYLLRPSTDSLFNLLDTLLETRRLQPTATPAQQTCSTHPSSAHEKPSRAICLVTDDHSEPLRISSVDPTIQDTSKFRYVSVIHCPLY